jgi:hypothetical protein
MNVLLVIASLGEAAAGVIVLAYPPIVARVLFAAEIGGAGVMMSRIAGIALIGLGVACWPRGGTRQTSYGMLTYSTLVMLYLIVVGTGGPAGFLLWPAVVVHALLSLILGFAILGTRASAGMKA